MALFPPTVFHHFGAKMVIRDKRNESAKQKVGVKNRVRDQGDPATSHHFQRRCGMTHGIPPSTFAYFLPASRQVCIKSRKKNIDCHAPYSRSQ